MQETKLNLCDYCLQKQPECDNILVEFGNGTGNDNVINCDGFAFAVKGRGSQIKQLGLIKKENGAHDMLVEFTNGAIYRYFRVPLSEFRMLCEAPSMGGYFNQYVKYVFDYQGIKKGVKK